MRDGQNEDSNIRGLDHLGFRSWQVLPEVLLEGDSVAITNSRRHVGVQGVFAPLINPD